MEGDDVTEDVDDDDEEIEFTGFLVSVGAGNGKNPSQRSYSQGCDTKH